MVERLSEMFTYLSFYSRLLYTLKYIPIPILKQSMTIRMVNAYYGLVIATLDLQVEASRSRGSQDSGVLDIRLGQEFVVDLLPMSLPGAVSRGPKGTTKRERERERERENTRYLYVYIYTSMYTHVNMYIMYIIYVYLYTYVRMVWNPPGLGP